jgi:hypothetical protein
MFGDEFIDGYRWEVPETDPSLEETYVGISMNDVFAESIAVSASATATIYAQVSRVRPVIPTLP